jgi:predicted RNA-binding protein YlxR (DUF448 family)
MPSPIRMCINCRTREIQPNLLRLQCKDKKLILYTHVGRSFYICTMCYEKQDKKSLKALSRACKKEIKIIDLECLIHG